MNKRSLLKKGKKRYKKKDRKKREAGVHKSS